MQLLESIFSNTVIAFILLISVVVFVHELGHFLVGKLFGIRVEEFSIGFGPKAIGFHYKETEYRLNWLPLGGYVRFYGADTRDEIQEHFKEKSISHARVYKRILVYFAGPFANFLLSFVIMTILSWHGLPENLPVISVLPQTQAASAGLKTGDRVLSVDGKSVQNWKQLTEIISNSPEKNLSLVVERNNKQVTLNIKPKEELVETIYGSKKKLGRIGVSTIFSAPAIIVTKNSFFSAIQLQTGDIIQSVNEKNIHFLYEFFYQLQNVTHTTSDAELAQKIKMQQLENVSLSIAVQRHDKTFSLPINFNSTNILNWAKNYSVNKASWTETTLPLELKIKSFVKDPASQQNLSATIAAWQACHLNEGDVLVGAEKYGRFYNSMQISLWLESLSKTLTAQLATTHFKHSLPLSVFVLNKLEQEEKLNCNIPVRTTRDALNRNIAVVDLPVEFAIEPRMAPPVIVRQDSPLKAISQGYKLLIDQMSLIYNGLKLLFSGQIPLSNLGGPIAVAHIAGFAAKAGLISFLLTMSLISANIGIVNLIPLPALDGGHLLLGAVEAAYGKPLPMRIQNLVQQLGVFIIIILFIIAFYNDILRLFSK